MTATTTATRPAVTATGLRKSFGGTTVLGGIDLIVAEGTIFSLLGPNGAGKSTIVRILSTLIPADSGEIQVAGFRLADEPDAVRAAIGVTGQFSAVDGLLTGEENLLLMADLHHLGRREGRRRAAALLERFGLADAGRRQASTYSGGLVRRLDLAMTLVGDPRLIFLDEPTTGLDPRGRLAMWDVISSLVADGTTVLLTTQYLEEADQLANHIVVIDLGKVIARGTSDELKTQVGGERLELTVARRGDLDAAVEALRPYSQGEILVDEFGRQLIVPTAQGAQILASVVRDLDSAGIRVDDLALRRPTLDDGFLSLTGHATTTGDLTEDMEAPRPLAMSTR